MNDRPPTADGFFATKEPVQLPDVLDVLIIGGGPCGTAAAFRAREHGLSALVLELDDLMKRIRDYAKDKLILPSFGGGDQTAFPRGGDLIETLHFQPIDKDDMCRAWKQLYHDLSIPAKIGVEVTGLEREADGTLTVHAWNHRTKSDETHRARHVIVGVGRGVPRRFDIPGNTDGIAFRLDDPATYVGAPACVIGGGTSAAEAVIAVSEAKAAANDPTAVYWSYRGDRMPKVSKALADVFFAAYMQNGNIRYRPHSEPVAVVTAHDRLEYLAVRVDRRCIEGRPTETAHLEFPKTQCIACIGEDIPEAFLAGMGIHMMEGGPKRKKRMVVTPLLETQQQNVYLIGDILSQAYLQTTDFDADPATFEEVRHRGNVKSALRDGVYVVDVIQARLATGERDVQVTLEDAEPVAVGYAVEAPTTPAAVTVAPPAEASPDETAGWIVRLLPGNVEEDETPVGANGVVTIGRSGCDLTFADDALLSDRHASITHGDDGVFLRDDGGKTGTFLRVPEAGSMELGAGSLVHLGRQFLLVVDGTDGFELAHFDQSGQERGRWKVTDATIVLGRQAPDVTLDASDTVLSRRHVSVTRRNGAVVLKDLKSLNGTFVKVRGAVRLEHGTQFRVGRQRFAFTTKLAEPIDASVPPPASTAPVAPAPASAPPAAAGDATVTFGVGGTACPARSGQTICDVAEAAGIELVSECHAGVCGSDPVRVVEGAEHLSPLDDTESETLEDICEKEPGAYRLACMAKVSGPVVVEIEGD